MLFMLLPLIIGASMLFMTMVHPLSCGLVLMTETILVASASGLAANSFWFSYILFLIFLGAMLVLFIYVASIASNEQFMFSFKSFMFFMTGSIFALAFFSFFDQLYLSNKVSTPFSSLSSLYSSSANAFQVSPIYNIPSFSFTIFIILYLLLTLIVIVKIMSVTSNPLRFSN